MNEYALTGETSDDPSALRRGRRLAVLPVGVRLHLVESGHRPTERERLFGAAEDVR